VTADPAYKKLRVFVASPGDVAMERAQITTVADRLNRGIADRFGVVLEVVEWRQIAPAMGRPEDVILRQLPVESWDLVIGILWLRFGMAPGAVDPQTRAKFESGTEEEFKLAYRHWKETGKPRIMFYRCQRPPASLDQVDPDQLRRVRAFFDQFSADAAHAGLYKSYQTPDEFQQLVYDDLTRFLIEYDEARKVPPAPPPEPASHRIMFKGKEYVYIPAGPFSMGTNHRRVQELTEIDQSDAFGIEAPQHQVNLAGYYIARHPVTNAEYRKFIEATGYPVPFRHDDWSKPFNWNSDTRTYPEGKGDHPVALVSWYDAQAFCNWLGARLPTEAEWEKAARGTDGREWPWGNVWLPNCCNTEESGIQGTVPVGKFSPGGDSPYGVSDMAGNIWEWCSSLREAYPYQPGDGREDLVAEGKRVLRGGALGMKRWVARCAFRNAALPGDYGFSIGFRVALLQRPESTA
jgi:formylglycine-generating enzyme required for sulfatase activity